jgi:glycolate oxidase FAD binding subunit
MATVLNKAPLTRDLAAILGEECVRSCTAEEAKIAEVIVEPRSIEEVSAIVRKCESDRLTLAAIGAARTLMQIRRDPVAIGVSLARMNRIVAYEPEDMTVVVESGLKLGDLNRLAAEQGQRLPIDPAQPDGATIGSVIAGAQAGPFRLSEGTVRDLLIGIAYVGHDGRLIRAGGRVVKNVTGYDLMKVMVGSYGTLGIIVEAAFKVRPIPPNYSLAMAGFSTIADAFATASRCGQAAPLVHCEVVSRSLFPAFPGEGKFVILAGFSGIPTEVEYQRSQICSAIGSAATFLEAVQAEEAYRTLRDLAANDHALVAQLATMPNDLPAALATFGVDFRAHALSGIARLYLSEVADVKAGLETVAEWRSTAHAGRGYLRVIAARPDLRARLQMFDEPNRPALALMRRLKSTFDPHHVFNPNCFVGGI